MPKELQLPDNLTPRDLTAAFKAVRSAKGFRNYSVEDLEGDWRLWITQLFPEYVSDRNGEYIPFSFFHEEFWEWVWAITPDMRPAPFIAIWGRGAAKSTSIELALVKLAGTKTRKYGLYVCEAQEQADDHVQNVAALLESTRFGKYYPSSSNRLVGKYGASKGWRRNRLRTAGGFTLDAIGLDTAARGAKMDDARPDVMVFDDLDSELDTPQIVRRKILALTRKLLPAGAPNMATMGAQNLVQPDGIFSQLADGRAKFLADRIISGPYKALEDMTYELNPETHKYTITGGRPTWVGQDLARCQQLLHDIGLEAFQSECQHEVEAQPGGLFDEVVFQHVTNPDPVYSRIIVCVDPAVTATDQSDCQGVIVGGLAEDGLVHFLFAFEQRTSPLGALKLAIEQAIFWGAEHVRIETDQGGDTWDSVYREAWKDVVGADPDGEVRPRIPMRADKAGASPGPKSHRASQMLVDYQTQKIKHLFGPHAILERALRRFPLTKPFDLVDATYWCWAELTGHGRAWAGWIEHARREIERKKQEAEQARTNPIRLIREGGIPDDVPEKEAIPA